VIIFSKNFDKNEKITKLRRHPFISAAKRPAARKENNEKNQKRIFKDVGRNFRAVDGQKDGENR
jgi:hypothetical protein